MRRAIRVLALAAVAVTLAMAPAHSGPQVVDRVDGTGIVDYSRKPTFKVGDWVRYRMLGESALGMSDDYELTILIAGEEHWWGEDCFWVETWTDAKGRVPQTTATLMSYAIFDDTSATQRMKSYQRKAFGGLGPSGEFLENVVKPASSALKSRTAFQRPLMWDVDTLEADTVQTPVGLFQTRKVSIREGTGVTSNLPDSTLYTEVRENRMTWVTMQVPISHIAREDIESTVARRSWQLGRSADAAPLRLLERGTGSARLIGYGHGLASRVLPKDRQKSLAQWKAEAKQRETAAAAPAKRATARRR